MGIDKIPVKMYNMFSDRVADTCEACDQGSACGDSLFLFSGGRMAKPFLTYEQQIAVLENEKLLIIPDHNYAEKMLQQIGYFALIGGYKFPFKNSTTKKYRDGTTFDDIVALYKFDENLRELFLKYILRVERNIRSLLSYYFTEKFGEKQEHYLNKANYTTNPHSEKAVNRLIKMLSDMVIDDGDYPYINHYRHVHKNVPLWVIINAVTLGTLSKFYSLMTDDLKTKVTKNFESVNERQLEQYLSVITKFRNVCAHNERLFSYQVKNDIPDTFLHKKLEIDKNGAQYIYGKRDLFAVVIAFRYLLESDDFKKFKQQLNRILMHYFKSSSALSEMELLEYMGFPQNWEKVSVYKK